MQQFQIPAALPLRGLQQPVQLHWSAQDENGEFNADVARGVKAPEHAAAAPAAPAAAPLLLTNGPLHPLALGGPTLGLTTPPARPPLVTDIVYLVRCTSFAHGRPASLAAHADFMCATEMHLRRDAFHLHVVSQ